MGPAMGTLQSLTVLTLIIGLFSAIFWMIVGWRAMRAHERISESIESLVRQNYRKEKDSNTSKIE